MSVSSLGAVRSRQASDDWREYAPLLLRLLIGAFLVWGTQDNVFSRERMEEFAKFLEGNGFPWPMPGAVLSAYTQFLCGILLFFGAFVRWISIPLIVNFIAALLIAHRGDTFRGMFPAMVILAAAVFFLLYGAGRPSVDAWLARRRAR